MEQVNDKETKQPLVVLDSMLPRQVLKINVINPVFMELVSTRLADEMPFFGMLGLARLVTGESIRTGVQVDIVGKPVVDDDGLKLELRAGQCFSLVGGEIENAPQGWTEGRVDFLDLEEETDDDDELTDEDRLSSSRAASKAAGLQPLVDEWVALARTRERQEGQIDVLLQDFGDMPPDCVSDQSLIPFQPWFGLMVC